MGTIGALLLAIAVSRVAEGYGMRAQGFLRAAVFFAMPIEVVWWAAAT